MRSEYDAHKALAGCKGHRVVMTSKQSKAASKYVTLRKYGMPRWLASMISGI